MAALLTAIPLLLVAAWIVWLVSQSWRSALESEHGTAIREAQSRFGGILSPVFLGYRLALDDGWVRWRGGLFGPVTSWRLGPRKGRHSGWVGADVLSGDFFAAEHERPGHRDGPEALASDSAEDQ